MGLCKGCGKKIIWKRTKEGKAMPCDPEMRKIFRGGEEIFITENGSTVKGNTRHGPFLAYGWTPHWATCTEREKFKKKGGANGDGRNASMGKVENPLRDKRDEGKKEKLRNMPET